MKMACCRKLLYVQLLNSNLRVNKVGFFFMQKLQLNSGQELCTVNIIWNSSIESSNFTVNKGKYKDRIMFHTESYNFTVDKATENWHVVDFYCLYKPPFVILYLYPLYIQYLKKRRWQFASFFFFPCCAPVTG